MRAAKPMTRRIIIATVVMALLAAYLVYRQNKLQTANPTSERLVSITKTQTPLAHPQSARQSNELGDILTDADDPVFLNQVFPKFREFVVTLDRMSANPFEGEIQPGSCKKIQIIPIPNGIICKFVIGDGWTADYTENPVFSGITYFGQRGPNNPIRAISHADTNTLNRLSQNAFTMPEGEVWRIANQVADAFQIDRSKFENPRMYEEGLFDYRLGIYTVEYRKKGSDPINGLNYTRGFGLRATSPTSAVLVSYSHLEATLR